MKKGSKLPFINRTCEVCGKDKESGYKVNFCKKINMYLCNKHYQQIKLYGTIKQRTRKDLNEIVIYDTYAEIILYDLKNEEKCRAIIDIEDIDKVKNYKWSEMGSGYATATYYKGDMKTGILLHRLIMGLDDEKDYDHKDGNRKDCRKQNLRPASSLENAKNRLRQNTNTSGFIGVSWSKVKDMWRSYIQVDYKQKHLGYFDSIRDATFERIKAEMKYYKEYRNLYNENEYIEVYGEEDIVNLKQELLLS